MYVQGAQIDLDVSLEVIVACIVAFFELSLARHEREMVTVLIDLRKGPADWKNIPGHNLVPLARAFNAVFKPYFPERLFKMIVYPMPWYGLAVWNIVSLFLDTKTASKVDILKGPTEPISNDPFVGAPDPERLKDYTDETPTFDMIVGGGVSPVLDDYPAADDGEEDSSDDDEGGLEL